MNAAAPVPDRFEQAFARALFASASTDTDTDTALEASPIASLLRQPAFAVYRNTVAKACIDALEANYPVVARLVGSDWFRAAARLYVEETPLRDGRLLHYGAGFAGFLAQFEPAAALPYLPGAARLDRCWTEAHAAADAPAADPARLACVPPDALATLVLKPHPAARWAWFDAMPVYSIWRHNRSEHPLGDDNAPEFAWHGEGALLARPEDAVTWCEIGRAEVAFLDACAAGRPLAAAAEAALGAQPDTDLSALLARLLRAGAFTESLP